MLGGALGLSVAWSALRLFVRTAPVDLPRVNEVAVDARVLVFAAAVSILCGIVVAILPAWRLARRDVQTALRSSGPSATSDRGGMSARATLLALQVGLSVTLLVVTALLGTSFIRVLNVNRGFVADRVIAFNVALPANRYAAEQVRVAAYDRLLAAIRAAPGGTGATTTSMLPLAGQGQVNGIAPEGGALPRSEQPTANFRMVAPDFFRTLGIAVLRGRSFSNDERAADRPFPALISEPTARRLWPTGDALGKRFSRGIPGERGFEVVGIVADAHTTSLERTPPLMVYVPYWWRSRPSMPLLVRTTADPATVVTSVRRAIQDIDPEIATGEPRRVEQLVDASVAGRRYQMELFIAFAAIAVFIAMIGVYAVTSYGISRRRREMNIRVARGAQKAEVVAMMLRQGVAPIVAGAVAGAAGAIAIGGVVASLLFEVRARDPFVIGAVVTAVTAIGIAACLIAARQGLVIDPAAALREE